MNINRRDFFFFLKKAGIQFSSDSVLTFIDVGRETVEDDAEASCVEEFHWTAHGALQQTLVKLAGCSQQDLSMPSIKLYKSIIHTINQII